MEEQTVYGVKACLALLERRPQDVLRLYHHAALRARLRDALAWAASQRLPYRELDEDSLRKVARSTHHEGLVVVARPLRYRAWEPAQVAAQGGTWLALDGVENPHNLGAILRTAAFFALGGVVAGGETPGAKVNGALLRVAEGAAERVPLHAAPRLPEALAALHAAGVAVIGLETDARRAWWEAVAAGAAEGAAVLVLGNEAEGLSVETRKVCTLLCRLEGPGPMASLNVSVATAVALAALHQHRTGSTAAPAPGRAPGRRPRPPRRR